MRTVENIGNEIKELELKTNELKKEMKEICSHDGEIMNINFTTNTSEKRIADICVTCGKKLSERQKTILN